MFSKHAKAAKTNAKRFSIEAHCYITASTQKWKESVAISVFHTSEVDSHRAHKLRTIEATVGLWCLDRAPWHAMNVKPRSRSYSRQCTVRTLDDGLAAFVPFQVALLLESLLDPKISSGDIPNSKSSMLETQFIGQFFLLGTSQLYLERSSPTNFL